MRWRLTAASLAMLAGGSAAAEWARLSVGAGATLRTVRVRFVSGTSYRVLAGGIDGTTPVFYDALWDLGTADVAMGALPTFARRVPVGAQAAQIVTCVGFVGTMGRGAGTDGREYASTDLLAWTSGNSLFTGSPLAYEACAFYPSGAAVHGFVGGTNVIKWAFLGWHDGAAYAQDDVLGAGGAPGAHIVSIAEATQAVTPVAYVLLTDSASATEGIWSVKLDSYVSPSSAPGPAPNAWTRAGVTPNLPPLRTLAATPDGQGAVALGDRVGRRMDRGALPAEYWSTAVSFDPAIPAGAAFQGVSLPSARFALAAATPAGAAPIRARSYDGGKSFGAYADATISPPLGATSTLHAVDCANEDTCVFVGTEGVVVFLKNRAPAFVSAGPLLQIPAGSPSTVTVTATDYEGDPVAVDWSPAASALQAIEPGFVAPTNSPTVTLKPAEICAGQPTSFGIDLRLSDGRRSVVQANAFTLTVTQAKSLSGQIGPSSSLPASPILNGASAAVSMDATQLQPQCRISGYRWTEDASCMPPGACGPRSGNPFNLTNNRSEVQCENHVFAWSGEAQLDQDPLTWLALPGTPPHLKVEGLPVAPLPAPTPNPLTVVEGGSAGLLSFTLPSPTPLGCDAPLTTLRVRLIPSGSTPPGAVSCPGGSCESPYNVRFQFQPRPFTLGSGCTPYAWTFDWEGRTPAGAVSAASPPASPVRVNFRWDPLAPEVRSFTDGTLTGTTFAVPENSSIDITARAGAMHECQQTPTSFTWTRTNSPDTTVPDPVPPPTGPTVRLTAGSKPCGATTKTWTFDVSATSVEPPNLTGAPKPLVVNVVAAVSPQSYPDASVTPKVMSGDDIVFKLKDAALANCPTDFCVVWTSSRPSVVAAPTGCFALGDEVPVRAPGVCAKEEVVFTAQLYPSPGPPATGPVGESRDHTVTIAPVPSTDLAVSVVEAGGDEPLEVPVACGLGRQVRFHGTWIGCPMLTNLSWQIDGAPVLVVVGDSGPELLLGTLAGVAETGANVTVRDYAVSDTATLHVFGRDAATGRGPCLPGETAVCRDSGPNPLRFVLDRMLRLKASADRVAAAHGEVVRFAVSMENVTECAIESVVLRVWLDGFAYVAGSARVGAATSEPVPFDGFDAPEDHGAIASRAGFEFAEVMIDPAGGSPAPVVSFAARRVGADRPAAALAAAFVAGQPEDVISTPTAATGRSIAPIPGLSIPSSCSCASTPVSAAALCWLVFPVSLTRRRLPRTLRDLSGRKGARRHVTSQKVVAEGPGSGLAGHDAGHRCGVVRR